MKKICAAGKKSEDLPEDIIYDIFSRFPIKSLMRSRCLSRFHNSLFGLGRDPNFVDLYHQRGCSISNSLSNSTFVLRTWQRRKEKFCYYSSQNQKLSKKTKSTSIPSKLRDVSYHKVEYAKGLFCLWSEKMEPVFIFNPTTRESRYVPRLDIDFGTNYQCHCSLGFDPNLNKHKLLMTIYDPEMKLSRHCWVFTLGETTWREINCDRITNFYPKTNCEGVYVDGAVYFYCGHCTIYGYDIVAFNCRIEEVRIISLWDNYLNDGRRIVHRFHLGELEGKLAAIDVMFNYIIVFILQSPETGEWIRQLKIVIPPRFPLAVATSFNTLAFRRCTSSLVLLTRRRSHS